MGSQSPVEIATVLTPRGPPAELPASGHRGAASLCSSLHWCWQVFRENWHLRKTKDPWLYLVSINEEQIRENALIWKNKNKKDYLATVMDFKFYKKVLRINPHGYVCLKIYMKSFPRKGEATKINWRNIKLRQTHSSRDKGDKPWDSVPVLVLWKAFFKNLKYLDDHYMM